MDRFDEAMKEYGINDRSTKDAVMAFANVLRIVKDIFGEERMSENVMQQAIEAGSYIGYRSIMGEAAQKYAPNSRR